MNLVLASNISYKLKRMGIRAGELHSDLSQTKREIILGKFRTGSLNVVVVSYKTNFFFVLFCIHHLSRFCQLFSGYRCGKPWSRRARSRLGHSTYVNFFFQAVKIRGEILKYVLFYSQVEAPPSGVDYYIHRSGRTGRAGRVGKSVLIHSGSADTFYKEVQFVYHAYRLVMFQII